MDRLIDLKMENTFSNVTWTLLYYTCYECGSRTQDHGVSGFKCANQLHNVVRFLIFPMKYFDLYN